MGESQSTGRPYCRANASRRVRAFFRSITPQRTGSAPSKMLSNAVYGPASMKC